MANDAHDKRVCHGLHDPSGRGGRCKLRSDALSGAADAITVDLQRRRVSNFAERGDAALVERLLRCVRAERVRIASTLVRTDRETLSVHVLHRRAVRHRTILLLNIGHCGVVWWW